MDTGFYDLHTHILPGVDDGPETMEDAVEMARMASQDGTRAILATPHRKDVIENHSVDYIRDLIRDLSQELRNRGIQIDLLLGMENHLELDLPQQVSQGKALTMNGSRYILVELPFTIFPTYAMEVLFQLQIKGLIPVIVHPERNAEIQKRPSLLGDLVERGFLAQVTAGSILGSFGSKAKKSAKALLQRGFVHIISSDAHHNKGHRIPVLSCGVAEAAKIVGTERAYSMVRETPKAVLEDRTLEIEMPDSADISRPWWRLW